MEQIYNTKLHGREAGRLGTAHKFRIRHEQPVLRHGLKLLERAGPFLEAVFLLLLEW